MQINRTISRSKEVVYSVGDTTPPDFHAVIDENHRLLIVYPHDEVTRPHARAIDKLISKAKARDGIKDHQMYLGRVLREEAGELVIERNIPAE